TASRSMRRNSASPDWVKISLTLRPAARSTSSSVSRTVHPVRDASALATVDFPAPGGPMSTTAGPPPGRVPATGSAMLHRCDVTRITGRDGALRQRRQVAARVAGGFAHRVATELLDDGV